MKKISRIINVRCVVAFAAIVNVILVLFIALGLRINITTSAPIGLWRVEESNLDNLARQELVEICPPNLPVVCAMASQGYLETGDCQDTKVLPFLKPIAAIPGDKVVIKQGEDVAVNQSVLPNTKAFNSLPAWPDGTYSVAQGQVWLFSTYSPSSFDSRYFGPVEVSNVRGKAVPLLVKGDAAEMTRTISMKDDLCIACAPNVPLEIVKKIIDIESGGDELAINVNAGHLSRRPLDAKDAAQMAREFIEKGYSVDMGLMQVNSRNVHRLGYTVEDMFQPCKNIAAGSRILTEFYSKARKEFSTNDSALYAAISAYNTGNFNDGFSNGYVNKFSFGSENLIKSNELVHDAVAKIAKDTLVYTKQEEKPVNSDQKSEAVTFTPVVSKKHSDVAIAGVQVEFTAADAEAHGAFPETALSEADAWLSNLDLHDPKNTAIVVSGKKVTK